MKQFKIRVRNENHFRFVQKQLFALGYGWNYNGKELIKNLETYGIYTSGRGSELNLLRTAFSETFDKLDLHEIDTDELLVMRPQKIESNRWYKINGNPNSLMSIVDSSGKIGRGFDDGKWYDRFEFLGCVDYQFEPANKEDVKMLMKREAFKRGFTKIGARTNSMIDGSSFVINNGVFSFKRYLANKVESNGGDYDDFMFVDSMAIYKNGVWSNPPKSKGLKIEGYTMKQDGDYVRFGCKSFRKEYVKDLYKDMNRLNIDVIVIDDYNINRSTVLEVIDNFQK